EDLADDVAFAGRGGARSRLGALLGGGTPDELDELDREPGPVIEWPAPGVATQPAAMAASAASAHAPPDAAAGAVYPVWDNQGGDAVALGPWAWFRARLADSPLRGDRSRLLEGERGGRLDKLDLWFIAVLAISLLTVRMWRLDEPYQMHFDEVYHPRTATEFLQDWRYGLSHDIYEWTHPHMAKYAMAVGIMAFGEDHVGATSQLDVPVVAAVIEPRRDDGQSSTQIEGDRLWIATGSEVRAYDLATRSLVGSVALPGAVALAYDAPGMHVFAGTRSGPIREIDTTQLDGLRSSNPVEIQSDAFMTVDGQIEQLFATKAGDRLAAVLAASPVVLLDTEGATEIGTSRLIDVSQITEAPGGQIAVGTESGVAFIS